jgi:cobalt-zinc-cadmium efflux system outer membrane protein
VLFGLAVTTLWSASVMAAEPVAHASQLLRDPTALKQWVRVHLPQFSAIRARSREAVANARDARLLPNPTLSLGIAGITLGDRNPRSLSATDTQNYQATLSETIELGKRGHRIRAADLHAQAIDLENRYDEALLLADARESLAKVVYLKERKRVLEERLQAARGIVTLDETRLERGDVSGIDHNRLLLDVVNVERELADNENEMALARSDCEMALGGACDPDIDAAELDGLIPRPDTARFLPAERTDVRSLRLEARGQGELAEMYGNRSIPDPIVGLTYVHDNLTVAGNQPHTLGVTVTLPLPLFDRGQHQRAGALARGEEIEAQATSTERAAGTMALRLGQAEQTLAGKLSTLQTNALPLADRVLESTERAYRLGQVSMTDLLLARRQRGEIALDLVDTRYALFELRSRLLRVLGDESSVNTRP